MKTYKVTITEILQRTVEVKADSTAEAECAAEEKWNDSEYILSAEDFVRAEFSAAQG